MEDDKYGDKELERFMASKCGCGRRGRYCSVSKDTKETENWGCTKYGRCPDRGQLLSEIEELKSLLDREKKLSEAFKAVIREMAGEGARDV